MAHERRDRVTAHGANGQAAFGAPWPAAAVPAAEQALRDAGATDADLAGLFGTTNGSVQANTQAKVADFGNASEVVQAIQAIATDVRFCGALKKGQAAEKDWHNRPRTTTPATWGNWHLSVEWYCVNPHSAGVYLVDLDKVLVESGDQWVEREGGATKEEALELASLLGGRAYTYESTRSKGKWHLLYAAAPNGGQDWSDVDGAPKAGFACQGGLLLPLPSSGSIAVFDLRGGGEYPKTHRKAGQINGCRIDADRRRLVMLLRAMHMVQRGELQPIEHIDQLVKAYELAHPQKAKRKPNNDPFKGKPVQDGASGVHDELVTKTAAIARLPIGEHKAALDDLKAWARRMRPDRDTDDEIDRLYEGALAYIKDTEAPGADTRQYEPKVVYKSLTELVESLNKRYAMYTGKDTRIIDEASTAASDDLWPTMIGTKAFEDAMAHVKVEIEQSDGRLIYAKAAPQWMKHKDRRRYKGAMELLGPDEERRNPYAYPIVIRSPTDLREGDAAPLIDYLRNTLCDGDDVQYEWLANWLADCVQRPHAVGPGTAVVITGAVGTGKSMLFEHVMMPVLGAKHCQKMTDVQAMLGGGFNHELLGKTLCFADEAIFERDRKLAQRVKDWTMAQSFRYERKFQDAIVARNTNRLLAATNAKVAAMLEAGDRRFLVVGTPQQFTDDEIAEAKNVEQFKPIVQWFAANVPVMAHWFMHREYDLDRLRAPPNSDAKRRAVYGSDTVLQVLADIAADGVIPGDRHGEGAVSSAWLARETGDRHVSTRSVVFQVRDLLGKENVRATRNAYDVLQTARKGEDGWTARLGKRGNGMQMPSPADLAELINPRLPTDDRIIGAAEAWEKWLPDAHTIGGDDAATTKPAW